MMSPGGRMRVAVRTGGCTDLGGPVAARAQAAGLFARESAGKANRWVLTGKLLKASETTPGGASAGDRLATSIAAAPNAAELAAHGAKHAAGIAKSTRQVSDWEGLGQRSESTSVEPRSGAFNQAISFERARSTGASRRAGTLPSHPAL
jgi:hypothetical protein